MVLHLHADVLYESSVYTIAYNNIRLELLSPLSVWALCIYSSRRIDLRVGVEISLWTRVLAEHSHAELCSPKSNHSKQSTNQQQGMIIDFVIHHIIWLDMRSLAELTRAQTKLFAASKPCHQAPELLVGPLQPGMPGVPPGKVLHLWLTHPPHGAWSWLTISRWHQPWDMVLLFIEKIWLLGFRFAPFGCLLCLYVVLWCFYL